MEDKNEMQGGQLHGGSGLDVKIRAFYAELDPEKRMKLMDEMEQMLQADETAGAPEISAQDLKFRRELLQRRYHRQGRNGYADNGMLICVMLLELERNNLRGRKAAAKMEEAVRLMIPSSVSDGASFTPLQREAFYQETRNIIHRYLTTCMDQSYHRKFFGLMRLSDSERAQHMLDDIWNISYGSVLRSDHFMRSVLTERMELWCRAAEDEFSSISQEAARAMADRKHEKNLD